MAGKKLRYYKGLKVNKLTILEEGTSKDKVLCRCDCGVEKLIFISAVVSGHTRSCGCLMKGNPKHELSKHPLYGRYRSMIDRCYNPNNQFYENYGAKGIYVCERWLEPNHQGLRNFIEDKFPSFPGPGYHLDKDILAIPGQTKCYSPETTMWVNHSEHSRFTQKTFRKLTSDQVRQIRSLKDKTSEELSEMFGVNCCVIKSLRIGKTYKWVE